MSSHHHLARSKALETSLLTSLEGIWAAMWSKRPGPGLGSQSAPHQIRMKRVSFTIGSLVRGKARHPDKNSGQNTEWRKRLHHQQTWLSLQRPALSATSSPLLLAFLSIRTGHSNPFSAPGGQWQAWPFLVKFMAFMNFKQRCYLLVPYSQFTMALPWYWRTLEAPFCEIILGFKYVSLIVCNIRHVLGCQANELQFWCSSGNTGWHMQGPRQCCPEDIFSLAGTATASPIRTPRALLKQRRTPSPWLWAPAELDSAPLAAWSTGSHFLHPVLGS